jgi:hypothetical protein
MPEGRGFNSELRLAVPRSLTLTGNRVKLKDKATERSGTSGLPHLLYIRLTDGGEVVSLYPREDSW